MRATVNREALLSALAHVDRVAGRSNCLPILECARLTVEGAALTLDATDLNLSATVTLGATVTESGSLCVAARALQTIIKSLPIGASVMLASTENQYLDVRASGQGFKVVGMAALNFPKSPALPDAWHAVDGEALGAMLTEVLPAISRDETRYHLNGACFARTEAGALLLLATDGNRLSRAERTIGDLPGFTRTIVPRRAVEQIIKTIGKAKKGPVLPVALGLSGDRAFTFVRVGDVVLSAKNIEAQFPDTSHVMGAQALVTVTCDADELRSAVALAKLIDESVVYLGAADGALRVYAGCEPHKINDRYFVEDERAEGNSYRPLESVDAETGKRGHWIDESHDGESIKVDVTAEYTGEPYAIGCNPEYLLRALGKATGPVALALPECVIDGKSDVTPIAVRVGTRETLIAPRFDSNGHAKDRDLSLPWSPLIPSPAIEALDEGGIPMGHRALKPRPAAKRAPAQRPAPKPLPVVKTAPTIEAERPADPGLNAARAALLRGELPARPSVALAVATPPPPDVTIQAKGAGFAVKGAGHSLFVRSEALAGEIANALRAGDIDLADRLQAQAGKPVAVRKATAPATVEPAPVACAWSPPPGLLALDGKPKGALPQGSEFKDDDGVFCRYYTDPTYRGPEYLRVREGKVEHWYELGGRAAA